MAQTYVITSGKGGVGKTTTTANVGLGLAQLGYEVALVDADIGLRNLDVVLGLENRIVYNLVDVVEGFCELEKALIRDKRQDNLTLLPAAQTKDKTAVKPHQMARLVEDLSADFDYVLVDSPAGLEQGFQNAMAGVQEGIVVTTPEVAAVRDADRIIGLLEAGQVSRPRLVINRIRPDMVQRGDMMTVDDITDVLAVDLLGIIPEDEQIVVASNRGEPIVFQESAPASRAFRNIARRIHGEEVEFMSLQPKRGFFQKLKALFS